VSWLDQTVPTVSPLMHRTCRFLFGGWRAGAGSARDSVRAAGASAAPGDSCGSHWGAQVEAGEIVRQRDGNPRRVAAPIGTAATAFPALAL
jgi:hypothetical protein